MIKLHVEFSDYLMIQAVWKLSPQAELGVLSVQIELFKWFLGNAGHWVVYWSPFHGISLLLRTDDASRALAKQNNSQSGSSSPFSMLFPLKSDGATFKDTTNTAQIL